MPAVDRDSKSGFWIGGKVNCNQTNGCLPREEGGGIPCKRPQPGPGHKGRPRENYRPDVDQRLPEGGLPLHSLHHHQLSAARYNMCLLLLILLDIPEKYTVNIKTCEDIGTRTNT